MDNTVLSPYASRSLSNLTTIQPLPPILAVPHAVHLTHFATSFPYLNPADLNPPLPNFDKFRLHPWNPTDMPTLMHYSRIILSLLTVNVPTHTLIFFFYIWSDPAIQLILCRDICLLSSSWSTFCELLLDAFLHQAELSHTETCDTIAIVRCTLHDCHLSWNTFNTAMHRFHAAYCLLHAQELLPIDNLLDLTNMLADCCLPANATTHKHGEQALSLTEMVHLQNTLITEHLQDVQICLFEFQINIHDGQMRPEDSKAALDQVIHCINALSDLQNLSCHLLATHLPIIIPPEVPNPNNTPCHLGLLPEPALPATPAKTAPNSHPSSPGFPTAKFSFVPPWEM